MDEVYEGAKSAVKEPEVAKELRRLSESVERLRKNCEQLASRLTPILQEALPGVEESLKEHSCETGLARELRLRTNDIQSLNVLVNNLMERMEL